MTPEKQKEYREEAERLAILPIDEQKQIIALHRSVADDTRVAKRDRDYARERADALERLLRKLNRKKSPNIS